MGYIILLGSFMFCFGPWKQIGNEMFFTCQLMFLSLGIFATYAPVTAGCLNSHLVMGYNSIFGQIDTPYPFITTFFHMGYSVIFYYNVNLMFGFQVLALLLYGVFRVVDRA